MPAKARLFMQKLSGRTHEVRTAVVVSNGISKQLHVAVSVSQVTFSRLSSKQIEDYIRTDEPYDKAGGYAVQGIAGLFIERIEGSYSGIMGLPVFETAQLLAEVAAATPAGLRIGRPLIFLFFRRHAAVDSRHRDSVEGRINRGRFACR